MRLDQKVDLVQNFLSHNEKDGGGDDFGEKEKPLRKQCPLGRRRPS